VPGPDPFVIGDGLAVAEHLYAIEIGDDFDAPADHPGMHRVVVGVQSHIVIPRQPGRAAPAHLWRYWRRRQHRLAIRADPVSRCAAQHPAGPPADDLQPLLQLVVEITGPTEGSAGKKRPLEVVMGPFDDAFVLGLSG